MAKKKGNGELVRFAVGTLLFCLAGGMGLLALSVDALPTTASPLVEQDIGVVRLSEQVIDLGSVERGSVARASFDFEYRSGGALQIKRIWTSCGCVEASSSQRTVGSGQRFSVDCELDTGAPGKRESTIFAELNDDRSLLRVGKVRFDVRSAWSTRANPVTIELGEGASYAGLTVTLRADEGISMDSVAVSCTTEFVSWDVEAHGRNLLLTPTFDPVTTPFGKFHFDTFVESESVGTPRFLLRTIVLRKSAEFTVHPDALSLGFIDSLRVASTEVRITSSDPSWRGTSVDQIGDVFTAVSIEPREPDSNSYTLSLSVPRGFTGPGIGQVIVRSTGAAIVIPVHFVSR